MFYQLIKLQSDYIKVWFSMPAKKFHCKNEVFLSRLQKWALKFKMKVVGCRLSIEMSMQEFQTSKAAFRYVHPSAHKILFCQLYFTADNGPQMIHRGAI